MTLLKKEIKGFPISFIIVFWKANLLAFQNNTLKKTIFEYRIISRKSSLRSKGFWFWGLCLFFCMFVGWLVGFWFF